MKNFAILGAGGFIGYRLTEYLLLNQLAVPRPVVRSFRSMARVSKFKLDTRIANPLNAKSLSEALRDCDVVFHCVVGNRKVILESVKATYAACRNIGAKRLVYLSSAVVHGHNPRPGTDESSPLITDQDFEYNVSKVLAEHELLSMMRDGAVECVILRPSIVFGPRSAHWSARLAGEILAGKAYLIDGGHGVCNTIFVDNLVEIMSICATHPAAAGKTLLVKDAERVTWRQLYTAIAEAIGVDPSSIRSICSSTFTKSATLTVSERLRNIVRAVWRNRFARAAKELVRSRGTVSLAIKLRARFQSSSVGAHAGRLGTNEIVLDPEMVSLQLCQYELPSRRLEETLNYKPSVSFEEGSRRTAEWLRFALGSRD